MKLDEPDICDQVATSDNQSDKSMNSSNPVIQNEDILAVISPHIPAGDGSQAITLASDSDLWDMGMDSLASVAVMVAVEETFDIEFPDEMLTRDIFTSAASIAAAVRELRTPATPGEGK